MEPSKPDDPPPVQWSDGATSRFEYERGSAPAKRDDLVCVCPTGTTETVFVVPKSEH